MVASSIPLGSTKHPTAFRLTLGGLTTVPQIQNLTAFVRENPWVGDDRTEAFRENFGKRLSRPPSMTSL